MIKNYFLSFSKSLALDYHISKLLTENYNPLLSNISLCIDSICRYRDENNNTILHIIFVSLIEQDTLNKALELLEIIVTSKSKLNKDLPLINSFIQEKNNKGISAIQILQELYLRNENFYFKILKYFLIEFSEYALDELQRTSLHYAILFCTYEHQKKFLNHIIKPLIEKDSRIIHKKDIYEYTILHYSISKGHELSKISTYIIENYSSLIKEKNIDGNTAFHVLTISHPFNVLKIILKNSSTFKNFNQVSSINELKIFLHKYVILQQENIEHKQNLVSQYNDLQNKLLSNMKIRDILHENSNRYSGYQILLLQVKLNKIFSNKEKKISIKKILTTLFSTYSYDQNINKIFNLENERLLFFLSNDSFQKILFDSFKKRNFQNKKLLTIQFSENIVYNSHLFNVTHSKIKKFLGLQEEKEFYLKKILSLHNQLQNISILSIFIQISCIPILISQNINTKNLLLISLFIFISYILFFNLLDKQYLFKKKFELTSNLTIEYINRKKTQLLDE